MIIDVSPTYQPHIDWAKVASAGVTGAWLKATEGQTWPESGTPEAGWLPAQQTAAAAAGIPTGCYHLGRPDLHPGPAGAATEAQHYLDKTSAGAGRLGDALDLEPAYAQKLTGASLAEWAAAFCAKVEAARGGQVRLYMARDTLWQLGGGYPGNRPLWLAWPGWANQVLPPRTFLVQTGQQQIPGIPGSTDVNTPVGTWTPPTPTPQPAPQPPTTLSEVNVAALPLIRTGSKGQAVKNAQGLLDAHGYGLILDGIFGAQTDAAVKSFQTTAHIGVDGIVGPHTWSALLGV